MRISYDPTEGIVKMEVMAPVPIVSADFNENGVVDGADLLAWQRDVRNVALADARQGDGNRDGRVDGADLAMWQAAFATSAMAQTGGVPEPAAGSLGLIAAAVLVRSLRRRFLH